MCGIAIPAARSWHIGKALVVEARIVIGVSAVVASAAVVIMRGLPVLARVLREVLPLHRKEQRAAWRRLYFPSRSLHTQAGHPNLDRRSTRVSVADTQREPPL
jgi:hypothetical protein